MTQKELERELSMQLAKSRRLADIMEKFNFTDDRIKDLMMHYPNLTVIGALVLVREIAEEALREYGQ